MAGDHSVAPGDVTRLLNHYAEGNEQSLDRIIPIVYQELKSLARTQLGRSGVRRHMQTTVLVHEAYEKLTAGHTRSIENRRHFFAIASRAMRQIVVDAYRAQMSAKRGGDAAIDELDTNDLVDLNDPQRVLQLDQAMETLAAENAELVEIVDLACFAGLSNSEIAELRGSNVRTVQRQMQRAKAWISHLLDESS